MVAAGNGLKQLLRHLLSWASVTCLSAASRSDFLSDPVFFTCFCHYILFYNALAAAARSPLILVNFSGLAAGWKMVRNGCK